VDEVRQRLAEMAATLEAMIRRVLIVAAREDDLELARPFAAAAIPDDRAPRC
jgi:hypothetical protein